MEAYTFIAVLVSLVASINASHSTSGYSAVETNPSSTQAQGPCDCYLVSGREPGYFQHYQFFDFRNVPLTQSDNEASLTDLANPPHPIPTSDPNKAHLDDDFDESNATVPDSMKRLFGDDATLLDHTPFSKYWQPQSWLRRGTPESPVTVINSKSNVLVVRDPHRQDSTVLILRLIREKDHASTAEIESGVQNIFHSSFRIRFRIFAADTLDPPADPDHNISFTDTRRDPPPGACAGFFTYNSQNVESDIEVLTIDSPTTRVHYANQPDYDPALDMMIPGASNISTLEKPWTEWATHRIDWTADAARFYEDAELRTTLFKSVPDRPSMLAVNLWSDGGEWTGDMPVGQDVFLGIEFIELVYNVSGVRAGEPAGKPFQRHPHRPIHHPRDGTPVAAAVAALDGDADMSADDDVSVEEDIGVVSTAAPKTCARPCWVDEMH